LLRYRDFLRRDEMWGFVVPTLRKRREGWGTRGCGSFAVPSFDSVKVDVRENAILAMEKF